MKSKHTEGKWRAVRFAEIGEPFYIEAETRTMEIAVIRADEMEGISVNKGQVSFKEAEANAKLIVQAPPMYELLTQLIEMLEDKSKTKDRLKVWEISVLKEAKEIIKEIE